MWLLVKPIEFQKEAIFPVWEVCHNKRGATSFSISSKLSSSHPEKGPKYSFGHKHKKDNITLGWHWKLLHPAAQDNKEWTQATKGTNRKYSKAPPTIKIDPSTESRLWKSYCWQDRAKTRVGTHLQQCWEHIVQQKTDKTEYCLTVTVGSREKQQCCEARKLI